MNDYRFGDTFDKSLAFEDDYNEHRCKYESYFTLREGIDCVFWVPTPDRPYNCSIGKSNCDKKLEIEKVKIVKV